MTTANREKDEEEGVKLQRTVVLEEAILHKQNRTVSDSEEKFKYE